MKKMFKKLNNTLEEIGLWFANMLINLVGITLMIAPGIFFTIVIMEVSNFFSGREQYHTIDDLIKYFLISILSLYIGLGFYKIQQGFDESRKYKVGNGN